MRRLFFFAICSVLAVAAVVNAQGRVTQRGRAIVEYRSDDVGAVASYEYSQRNHDGAWLLIELGVQTTERVAIHRDQLVLLGPDERIVPVATQQQFLEDQPAVSALLQNATIWRRSFDPYFTSRPTVPTIRFFSAPGGIVHDSAATNLDEVATGDLLFKAPDGKWPAGTYRLVLNHDKAKAELPITLQ